MTEEQANELAELIRSQLPLHYVLVMQSADTRNAPANYFVAVSRTYEEGASLIINSRYDWQQALLAWEILRD